MEAARILFASYLSTFDDVVVGGGVKVTKGTIGKVFAPLDSTKKIQVQWTARSSAIQMQTWHITKAGAFQG